MKERKRLFTERQRLLNERQSDIYRLFYKREPDDINKTVEYLKSLAKRDLEMRKQ